MKIKRELLCILMVLLMGAAFAGCTGSDKPADEAEGAGEAAIADTVSDLNEIDAEIVGGGGERFTATEFADFDLTMVNIWATWCGPCVGELPDLQKVYENLPDNVNMITICTDAENDIEICREILAESGATFKTLAGSDNMNSNLLTFVEAYPTTVFIDSSGSFVGKSLMGSASDIFYLSEIDARLAMLK